jgi:hypothetical protein
MMQQQATRSVFGSVFQLSGGVKGQLCGKGVRDACGNRAGWRFLVIMLAGYRRFTDCGKVVLVIVCVPHPANIPDRPRRIATNYRIEAFALLSSQNLRVLVKTIRGLSHC